MLTPKYLEEMPDDILKIFYRLEKDIIIDVSRRIAEGLELTETADYQIEILTKMGYNLKDIEKQISKATKISTKEIDKLLKESSELSYYNDYELYKKGGKILPPMTPKMNDFILASIKNAKGDLRNITRSMGIATNTGFKNITQFYNESLNYATFQVGSGTYSHQQALEQAVRGLAKSGVRTIDYKSGRSYHLDTAVRMNILTANAQITGYMSEQNADMMEQDLMEISSHGGARPTHAEWQGQIVSRSGKGKYLSLDDIGYGDPGGFKGVYCRHDYFPYFEGISTPAPREKELNPITYNNREYDDYQASQYQRAIERRIRDTQREIIAYDAAGLKDDKIAAEIKLKRQAELYGDFSNHAGIRAKWERTRVFD